MGSWGCTVRSNLDTVGPTVNVGQVTEVDKDTFWPIVKAAGDKTVVLDMYTQWYVCLCLYFHFLIGSRENPGINSKEKGTENKKARKFKQVFA